MTEQYTKYWELFIKQKANNISPEELNELEAWTTANEENASKLYEFEQGFKETSNQEGLPSFNAHDEWAELQTIIKIDNESKAAKTIRIFPWIARIAAAVILVLGFTYIFYQYQDLTSEKLNLQAMAQTDKSSQKEIALPDGSKVWLNRNSELLYPESFDGDTRTLYLKGEAFFEISPDKSKPFIVHSGSSKTTVLGTSFNLRAYDKEDEVKLTVVTGKVAFTLADDKEGVIVTPGDAAVLANGTKLISQVNNEDLNFLSWKTKQLMFDDTPMEKLINSLERHFNIKIDVENAETLNCRFTGDFEKTEIENAIKVITRATGTTYTINEGQYIINGLGCNKLHEARNLHIAYCNWFFNKSKSPGYQARCFGQY